MAAPLDNLNLEIEEEVYEEEEEVVENQIDSCDCCMKGWGEENEYGLCSCWCSNCGNEYSICRASCYTCNQ